MVAAERAIGLAPTVDEPYAILLVLYSPSGVLNDPELADEVQEQLRAKGWSVISVESERKPDLVVGDAWEDRSGFDLRLRCRTRDLRISDFIEEAA